MSTQPNPSNETRIRQMESELRSLRSQVKALAASRVEVAPGVRVVRAVENADVGVNQTVKTKFVKLQHSGSFDGVTHVPGGAVVTDRAAGQQSLAAWFSGPSGSTFPEECVWPVFRSDDGQWWLMPFTSVIGRVVNSDGIDAATYDSGAGELTPGEGAVEVWWKDPADGKIKNTGTTLVANNMVQSVVGNSEDAAGDPKPQFVQLKFDLFGDAYVDVEDCG